LKKEPFFAFVALFVITAAVAVVYALEIGPYDIDLGIIDRILGIEKLSAEEKEMLKEPVYKGSEFCKDCHAAEYELWARSKHNMSYADVDCEICHGVGRTEKVDDSREMCGSCHADIPFRNAIGKVNLEEHFVRLKCVKCHNPHNPWPAKAKIYGD
jgi:nitrate/TMAO reductase-like tetraheme cytochrome c subunit